jgi:hypothetical protein
MSAFKMVDDRAELARRLEALIEDNAETTARALSTLLASFASVSEEVLYEHELLRQQLLVRLVAELRGTMAAAAEAHRAESRRLDALRARRDATVSELYAELVDVRGQARRFYGDRAATVVGLRGRTHRKPWRLASQARLAVDCLAESVDGSGTISELDLARRRSWSDTLRPLQATIEPALAAVASGKAATIATLKAKAEAIADFDLRFGRVGRYVQRAYELAGLDELASRVPPRVARRDRRKSPAGRIRRSDEIELLPRGRLPGLADAVDFGRWIKQRLLRLRSGAGRRQAGNR